MTAMVRKPIFMPAELIEVVTAVATERRVSFAEAARLLMAKGAQMPDAENTNPFGLGDEELEELLTMATDAAKHAIGSIDDLLMTIEARNVAEARVAR